ncbi:hypothetical protein Gotur_011260 [Gossypium turneri]
MSGTIKVLNVAEKPSVAKSVSGILSRNQALRVRDGRSRYNRIFEFNYSIRGQPCHMLFTSVTGHLMELEFEDRFRKWHSCDPLDLYHAPVRKFVPEDKLDIKRTLEEEARRCQWLVLWLDCDREGENIAFEVINVCRAVNRHLTIQRARFSALIDRWSDVGNAREIHHAMQNLIDPNPWFSDAVDARQARGVLSYVALALHFSLRSCVRHMYLTAIRICMLSSVVLRQLSLGRAKVRSPYFPNWFYNECLRTFYLHITSVFEIDLRIGASFTRFQTMLLRDKFVIDSATDDRNLVLSYGPCQFPTLGFVVERYWEVQSHEPEEFWTINCSHRSDEGVATFNWMRGHLFDYTCAVIVYEMCVQEPTATVTKVQHKEKLKYPPYPLNTIELEKRASRYFRMSSEHTMKAIVQEQQGHPDWGSYAQRLLDPETGLWRNPGSGGHDDKAHPPIHPTKFSTGEHGWSQDHRTLYELVVRHFLACVSQPAVGAETTVEIDIAGELFSASGRRNYLDVYRYESWGGSMIPTYTVGQQFAPASLTLDTGVTRPPPLLSEADLLSCMDKAGIGTDATMHDHIKKLLDRFYATKDSNTRFLPTNLLYYLKSLSICFCGSAFAGVFIGLMEVVVSSMMEFDMKEVSVGNKSKDEVLATCLQQMKACFFDARLNKVKLLEAMAVFFERSNRAVGGDNYAAGEVVRQCDLCQESSMANVTPSVNSHQCRNAIWLPGSILEAAVTSNICSSCNPGAEGYKLDATLRSSINGYMAEFSFTAIPSFLSTCSGCIGGCDDTLRQLIEICGTGSRMSGLYTCLSVHEVEDPLQHPAMAREVATDTMVAYIVSKQAILQMIALHSFHVLEILSLILTQKMGTLQCPVAHVECHVFYELLIQQITGEESSTHVHHKNATSLCKWEDGVSNGNGGRSIPSTNCSASNSGRRGGRGQSGRNRSHAADTTFVSATGDPVSNRCYVCGDPSHFANVCPNRGM